MAITVDKFVGNKCEYAVAVNSGKTFRDAVELSLEALCTPGKYTKYLIQQWKNGEVILTCILSRK